MPRNAPSQNNAASQDSHTAKTHLNTTVDRTETETLDTTRTVRYAVDGMTCAACAARIQRKFDKHPGLRGNVNYATESATVHLLPGTTEADVTSLIHKIGFTLTPRNPDQASSTAAAGDALTSLRKRLTVAAVLAVPVMCLSMIPGLQFTGWQWLALALTTPVVAYCGYPFHRTAFLNARQKTATMDTLVSLGTAAAFSWSIWLLIDWTFPLTAPDTAHTSHNGGSSHAHHDTLTHAHHVAGPHVYFEAAAAITLFLLAGRYFELKSRRETGASVTELLTLGVDTVAVIHNGQEVDMPLAALEVGDRFVTRPGEKIATDGVVVDGASDVDTSLLTGEPVPVPAQAGDTVTGATLNTTGRLVIEATKVGADTQLAQIARLVENAQNGKAPVQRLADRISGWFVPTVLALSALTLGGWLLFGATWAVAFEAAVAVLIIACPCALGLATPMALLVGTGRGAQLGILVSGPEVLEKTNNIDTIVLDKTGTVTTATMTVTQIHTPGDDSGNDSAVQSLAALQGLSGPQSDVLALAAAVEHASEHPIAQAIVSCAQQHNLDIAEVVEFSATPGGGATGIVHGHSVLVGSASFATSHSQRISVALDKHIDTVSHSGHTPVVVAVDGVARAVMAIADRIKPTSKASIADFKKHNLRPVLLTGDDQRVAQAVADDVGISHVIAGATPQHKTETIVRLQAEGHRVVMVGDGVNDAAALAQADVGLAMQSGSDSAIQAADITLMRNDLGSALTALRLAQQTLKTIKTNLFWAFAYNVAAIPLAMSGLLNPMIAGAAMALSSVFVVANSLRLRRFA